MAYYSGTANSIADLQSVLRSACMSNGYALSGEVLHKGTLFVDTSIQTSVTHGSGAAAAQRDYLTVQAGLGIDGSSVLTGGPGRFAALGPFSEGSGTSFSYIDFAWPVTYFIHINTSPDEVWMVVNYNSVDYQHIALGQSPAPGCPGTGNWHFATCPQNLVTSNNISYTDEWRGVALAEPITTSTNSRRPWIPFWLYRSEGSSQWREAFHGMRADGVAAWSGGNRWGSIGPTTVDIACAATAASPLLGTQPNSWNQQSALIPMHLGQGRPEAKYSIVGTLQHLRILRMDFLNPGDEIDLSPDIWRVYPCKRKNTDSPGGGNDIAHSGCFGLAVRYTP